MFRVATSVRQFRAVLIIFITLLNYLAVQMVEKFRLDTK